MDRFQNHPVFLSTDTMDLPLSSTELQDVRKLLAGEKRRQSLANASEFTDDPEGRIDHVKLASRLYEARRARERIFGDSIFADPAWDLLLDLFIRTQRNEEISITSACHAAAVPEATALRYLKALEEKMYVERGLRSHDRRVTILKMTPFGVDLMIQWLGSFAGKSDRPRSGGRRGHLQRARPNPARPNPPRLDPQRPLAQHHPVARNLDIADAPQPALPEQ